MSQGDSGDYVDNITRLIAGVYSRFDEIPTEYTQGGDSSQNPASFMSIDSSTGSATTDSASTTGTTAPSMTSTVNTVTTYHSQSSDMTMSTSLSTYHAAHDGILDPPAANVLPCEFRDLLQCPAAFQQWETDGWVRHVRGHVASSFPSRSACWFCNITFNAKSKEDRKKKFEIRLRHVAWHILEDGESYEEMSPDFDLLKHMRKHKIISKEQYEAAARYTEPSNSYQLTGLAGHE